jgi:hypothetical protein
MHRTAHVLRNSLLFLIVFLIVGIFLWAIPLSQAADASRISGSYQIVEKTDLGSQTRVRLQLRLTNYGQQAVHIQRLTLWDFSHPHKGGTQPCTVILAAGASTGTMQEFTIPRAEYELWTRGTRPRLVVEVQSAHGRPVAEAIRLERVEGKAE